MKKVYVTNSDCNVRHIIEKGVHIINVSAKETNVVYIFLAESGWIKEIPKKNKKA